MMRPFLYLALAGVLVISAPSAFAQAKAKKGKGAVAATPEPVVETGFNAFRMIRLKNVFDPDRRPMPAEGAAKAAVAPTGPRSSFLVLTGTMVTETRRLAFFSGSQSDFNRVVKAHDKLGDCEVESISTTTVDLKRGADKFILPVGQQITLGEKSTISNAPVTADLPPPSALPAPGAPPASAVAPPPAASIGAPSDPGEVMRRMMERRQKEIK